MAEINKKTRIILVAIFLAVAVVIFGGFKLNETRNSIVGVDTKKQNLLAEKTTNVTLAINTGDEEHKFESKVSSGSTVMDLLKISSKGNGFSLSYKDTSAGAFVDEIYGMKNDTTNGKYWTYKVNGKFADIGASGYVVLDGDTIEWIYSDSLWSK